MSAIDLSVRIHPSNIAPIEIPCWQGNLQGIFAESDPERDFRV